MTNRNLDNERKHMIKSKFTIFPESSIKTAWDCIGFVFIVSQSILIPFNLCFGVSSEGGAVVFDTIIDVFFICDILINFNTGFYRKGVVVMKRKDIMINYLKGWFWLDLVASFPYSWFINFDPNDPNDDSPDSGLSIFRTP